MVTAEGLEIPSVGRRTTAALIDVVTMIVGYLVIVDLLTRCGTCSACRRGRSAMCKRPQGSTLSDGTMTMGAGLAEMVTVPAGLAAAALPGLFTLTVAVKVTA